MTAELLVNVTPSETRVAYIDGGILQEIHIEREARRGIVGNIYKGRVSRVLPGMQAAFVDIGLHDDGLVHISKMSKSFVKHPSEILKVGDIITVYVCGIDKEKGRVNLSLIEE